MHYPLSQLLSQSHHEVIISYCQFVFLLLLENQQKIFISIQGISIEVQLLREQKEIKSMLLLLLRFVFQI